MKLLNENISKNILNKLNESDFVNKTTSGTLSTIETNYESFINKWFNKFNSTVVNKHNLVVDEFLNSNFSKSIDELKTRVHDKIESRRDWVEPDDIIKLEVSYWTDTNDYEGFTAKFVVEIGRIIDERMNYITQEYYNKKNKDKEEMDKLHQYVQRVSNDGSKSYYILDDGYLQEVVKDNKYYDSDLITWSCYNAKTIKTARKFKSFDSATNFLNKDYDYYSDTHRISGLTANVEVVSLNQLLSGEITTKTDLSSLKSIKPSKLIEEPEEDDDTLSDEVTYTLTAEDGKVFTYTEPEYKNPEEAPNYEDMPIWNDIVKYSEDKGFTEIKSTDIDRVLVWTRDEDGNWFYNEEKSI